LDTFKKDPEPLFSYEISHVKEKDMTDFKVRGCTERERIDSNK
jgi:hypothetical protein